MSAFVLDASMALAWHFPDERSPRAVAVEALSDNWSVAVPRHWFAEVANGVLYGERRRRTTAEERVRFHRRVQMLDIDVDLIEDEQIFDHILPLARVHGLTIYDAFYLDLAERRGLPLASFDKELNEAARRVGIALLADAA